MSFILLLLTIAIFVLLELARSSRSEGALTSERGQAPMPCSTRVIDRYIHPAHSWVRVGASDAATVGVDDFAQRLIGHLDQIELPAVGSPVRQGQAMAILRRRDKSLVQVAPLSGVIAQINDRLIQHPMLVNDSPYERGWIAKITPTALRLELRNLLTGVAADRWAEAMRAELVRWFSPRLEPMLQDGGGLIDNISDNVSLEEWERLVNEFFPIVMPTRES